jgi:hypothetical protein
VGIGKAEKVLEKSSEEFCRRETKLTWAKAQQRQRVTGRGTREGKKGTGHH